MFFLFSYTYSKGDTMELYYKNAKHLLNIKPFNEFTTVTENTILQLNSITKQFTKREIQSKGLHIKTLIEYNVTGDWIDKINKSKKLGRDSTSLNSYVVRYGDDVGKRLHIDRIKSVGLNKERYIKKHGVVAWDTLTDKKRTFSEQQFVSKYGDEIGKQKWKETLNKKLKTQKENFKNKKWKNGRTLEEYQERHGIEDGYKRWNTRNKRHSYMVSLQRYIDEFGEVAGTKMCHKLKNNTSLDSFVNRYGDEIGKERYKLFIEKLLAYSENKPNYSKISQELFWRISVELSVELQTKVKFAELNDEQFYYTGDDLKIIQVDFKCGNKIIEFNGDFWHANPTQYRKGDILQHPNNHILAEDLWNTDKKRIDWLKSKGYDILIIWESDYNKNKKEVINKCINFINETT